MRRILLIIVLIMFCFSLSVLSKVEYEGWDRWDDELPSADSEKWHWAGMHQAVEHNYRFPDYEDITVLVTTGSFYYGAKPFKGKVSVLFYSSEDVDDWKISDSTFAIAVFPPKKNKILVRAYQKDIEGKFKCFEDWTIKFKVKKEKDIVSLESKFSQDFGEWFMSMLKVQLEKANINVVISGILPRIVVSNRTIELFPKNKFLFDRKMIPYKPD